MNKLYFVLIIFLYVINNPVYSQAHNEQHKESHTHKHAVSFVIDHAHLNNIENDWISVPSFGINYNYYFNEKWAIGLHNDIIIEDIVLEDEQHHEEIESSKPISSAIIVSYQIKEHIVLMAGGGREFSKHEDFNVIRFGIETPFHIANNWEVLGILTYDIGLDAYNSYLYGLGIAKLF